MLLVYRRGGMGDTLLVFPILEIFKKRGERVVAVGNMDYFNIAKAVGWADEVYYEIPKRKFSRVINVSFDGNLKPFPEGREWIVSYYLRSLGLSEDFSYTLNLTPLRDNPLKGKAVLHPSSGSTKKNPNITLFKTVEVFLKRQGYEVIYIVGEADQWVKDYTDNFWESHEPLEIGRALKEAKLYVGLDSGISHLASYMGLPSFIFYGPTDMCLWRPIGKRVFQISLNLSCSPCFPNVCVERRCLEVDGLFQAFQLKF